MKSNFLGNSRLQSNVIITQKTSCQLIFANHNNYNGIVEFIKLTLLYSYS